MLEKDTTQKTMIEATELGKFYGNLVAVESLSLKIQAGETFGLLGPNGAGKTTTLKMLTGSILPDKGKITISGEVDPTRPSVRKQIGCAPQELAIYEELSASENLRFFGSLYGLGRKELKERVDWALNFAGLKKRQSGRVVTYSGGMKRRLNLAIALVHDPPVMLLDEPTVGVDPQSRNMIFDAIEKLRTEGRTIIYTTHYMEEAERLCDRIAIMDKGRILAEGSVDELIKEHGGLSSIEIEFTEQPKDKTELQGKFEGNKFSAKTDKPLEILNKLSNQGTTFKEVKIVRPNLETVFLNLTGRSLRD